MKADFFGENSIEIISENRAEALLLSRFAGANVWISQSGAKCPTVNFMDDIQHVVVSLVPEREPMKL